MNLVLSLRDIAALISAFCKNCNRIKTSRWKPVSKCRSVNQTTPHKIELDLQVCSDSSNAPQPELPSIKLRLLIQILQRCAE